MHIRFLNPIHTVFANTVLSEHRLTANPFLCLYYLAVAATLKLFLNSVALKRRDLEVDASKLNNISNTERMSLIFRTKFFEYLVNAALFPNDQPHRSFKVHIVLLVFFHISLLFRVNHFIQSYAIAGHVRYLFKPLLLDV